MANINVDYQQLQTSAAQLRAGKDEVEAQLRKLQSMINTLVGSGFVTEQASKRFQASYDQWTSGASQVMLGLEGMSSYLNAVMTSHQDLDSGLAQAADS